MLNLGLNFRMGNGILRPSGPTYNVLAKVGTFTLPSSVGEVVVSGHDFRPKLICPFSSAMTSSSSTTEAILGFGVAQRNESGWNIISGPEYLTDSTAWSIGTQGTGISPTRTLIAAGGPNGNNATRLQFNLNGGTTSSDFSVINATGNSQTVLTMGNTYTYGVWLKSYDENTYSVQLRLSNQTETVSVTPEWTYFTRTIIAGGSDTTRFWIGLRGGQSPANSDTADILASEPQVALGDSVPTYAPSNQGAISVRSRTGQTTSAASRSHDSYQSIDILGASGTVDLQAGLQSINSDGFSYGASSVSGSPIINYFSLGGDIESNLVLCRMNGTNAAESFAHGLSGEPTAILLFSAINATAPPNTGTNLFASIGAWAGGNQFGASIYSNNGVTTTSTRRLFSTSHALARTTTAIQRSLAVSSVDATNVNVTYPDTTSTSQDYFWMLCLRNCRAQVGTFQLNGSLSPVTISCPGIQPRLFLPVFVPNGIPFDGSVLGTNILSIGASDGTNTVSCGITDGTVVTTTNSRRFQSSTALVDYDTAGTLIVSAGVSFSGQSVIVDATTNTSSTWGQGGYLIIGN